MTDHQMIQGIFIMVGILFTGVLTLGITLFLCGGPGGK
jgi:hypothetical protein